MSADPNMMSQMLMQKLLQPSPSPGTGQAGPGGAQVGQQGQATPQNAAAQMVQKAMLVRALQGGQNPMQMYQQHQANQAVGQGNAQIAQDPQMQAMQQGSPAMGMDPATMQQLQMQTQQPMQMPSQIPQGVS